jgi:hypothetical protein
MSDKKVWVEHSHRKRPLKTHTGPDFQHREATEVHLWASLGRLFCLYVRKLQTFISGVSSSGHHGSTWYASLPPLKPQMQKEIFKILLQSVF